MKRSNECNKPSSWQSPLFLNVYIHVTVCRVSQRCASANRDHSSQVQSYRFFLTGVITPVKKYLQTWFIVFCGAVNARLLMVRLNKTKPEGYMRPLDIPSGRGQSHHTCKAQTSRVRIPAGASMDFSGVARDVDMLTLTVSVSIPANLDVFNSISAPDASIRVSVHG
jgi:hypothetical protein